MTSSRSGVVLAGRGRGPDEAVEALDRRQPPDADDQRACSARGPPGVKRGSTPGGTTSMRSGRNPSSTISSLEDGDRVIIRLRR